MNYELMLHLGDSYSLIQAHMRCQSGYTEGKAVAYNVISIFSDMPKPGDWRDHQ